MATTLLALFSPSMVIPSRKSLIRRDAAVYSARSASRIVSLERRNRSGRVAPLLASVSGSSREKSRKKVSAIVLFCFSDSCAAISSRNPLLVYKETVVNLITAKFSFLKEHRSSDLQTYSGI